MKKEKEMVSRVYMLSIHDRVNELEREKKDLIAQVNALKELLIECTDNGELDGRLLSSYMEHYINNS